MQAQKEEKAPLPLQEAWKIGWVWLPIYFFLSKLYICSDSHLEEHAHILWDIFLPIYQRYRLIKRPRHKW